MFDPIHAQQVFTLIKVYAVEIAGTIVFIAVLCKIVWHELKSLFVGGSASPRKTAGK